MGGTAFAGVTVPAYPTIGAYPNWFTANNSVSNIDRAAGSDTTFYMMQQLADEYNQSGLYGCTLVGSGSGQNAFCDETTGGAPNYSDTTTTDTTDNFDSSEELMGLNDIGSGNGQQQLCGILPSPQAVDFSRSSKPIASNAGCTTLAEAGYAKDSVPVTDVQSIDPAAFGAATGYEGKTFTALNQTFTPPAFPASGLIGPVASGWLPGDASTCKPQGSGGGGPFCSGTPFDNVTGGTGTGATSEVYRLWCATDSTRITDWGQLTNLSLAVSGVTISGSTLSGTFPTTVPAITVGDAVSGAGIPSGDTVATVSSGTVTLVTAASGTGPETVTFTLAPGDGTPIGVPIRIIGVNKGSGTVATFNAFANSGVSGGGCSASPFNSDAASGPNPLSNDGYSGNLEIALENNASQVGDFAAADWPNDPQDQAVDIATSLYFMGYGYYNAIPNSGTIVVEPGTGTIPAGVPGAYVVSLTNENGISPSIANERSNNYPTARTLFNIWNTAKIRASAAGFLNWICDTNPISGGGGSILKGKDQLYGGTFDQDITNTIQQYGFSRITDTTPELNVTKQTPSDGLVTPNGTCQANLPISSTGTSTVTDTAGNVPTPVSTGWAVSWPANGATPGGSATVTGISGATLTLSASVPSTTAAIYFPGKPPVLAVTDPNS